jgi:hypothetical protein
VLGALSIALGNDGDLLVSNEPMMKPAQNHDIANTIIPAIIIEGAWLRMVKLHVCS